MSWIIKLKDGRYYVRNYIESPGAVPEISFSHNPNQAFNFPKEADAFAIKFWIKSTHSEAEVIKVTNLNENSKENSKEMNQKTAIATLNGLIEKLSISYRDEVSIALDVLGATIDERISVLGNLISAVAGTHKMLRQATYVDPQTLLVKIDRCLFEDDLDFDSVMISYEDYNELFVKNLDKVRDRYEEKIDYKKSDMLKHMEPMKTGCAGILANRQGNVRKTIIWSREMSQGEVLGLKKF